MMASFYYYDQNPLLFSFHILIGIPSEVSKAKTLKDSGRGSKMTSSCKWSIDLILVCLGGEINLQPQHYGARAKEGLSGVRQLEVRLFAI